ncbi:CLAVATA3/ESR (CLE)-related protein 12-like [Pistacia vera]|uniref:CLAVATA3/ESR (CLE)-related protein 12-like n=1 Tax=Pistacia vera TaxID=55513 RepID=UPI0012636464|nr:CLAVATA3/ESR (CLE)-related protein 12-like [Pistacia vera]
MATKFPQIFSIILSLSLFLFLLFFHSFNSIYVFHHNTLTNTKVSAPSKFDFTPFLSHHHHNNHNHRHHRKHLPSKPKTAGEDVIDPLYGVEKRLVPTGPNPLHH